jgi:hypothetical protein
VRRSVAEPGGICISRVVRDQIRDKLRDPFEDMGEQSVKNITQTRLADIALHLVTNLQPLGSCRTSDPRPSPVLSFGSRP